MSQSNRNVFVGLKFAIVDMTQETITDNKYLSYNDTMSITASNIMTHKKIQEDV